MDDPNKLSWVEFAMNICALLVALGVAGEFLGNWIAGPIRKRVDNAKDAEIARLNKQAGDAFERAAGAEKEAAEANRIAEQERLARLKIEQRMSDREITAAQREKMLTLLTKRAGGHVSIDSLLSEGREAFTYAAKIVSVFRDAGWNVPNPNGMRSFSSPLSGVLIDTRRDDAQSRELGEFIEEAFTAASIPVSVNTADPNLDSGAVLVLIGSK
jgi:hypothetical protein